MLRQKTKGPQHFENPGNHIQYPKKSEDTLKNKFNIYNLMLYFFYSTEVLNFLRDHFGSNKICKLAQSNFDYRTTSSPLFPP